MRASLLSFLNQEKRVVSWHIVPDDSLKHVASGLSAVWAAQHHLGQALADVYISDNINKEKSKPFTVVTIYVSIM